MAHIAFPDVPMTRITPQIQLPGMIVQRSPFSTKPVQILTRGVAFWDGTLTFPQMRANTDAAKAVQAFLIRAEGALHTFDIPLERSRPDLMSNNYKSPFDSRLGDIEDYRFPEHDESNDMNSVHVTARSPTGEGATRIGTAANLTLDVAVAPERMANPQAVPPITYRNAIGLKEGDWFSLHSTQIPADEDGTRATNEDGTDVDEIEHHHGAYMCGDSQYQTTVLAGPAPPAIPQIRVGDVGDKTGDYYWGAGSSIFRVNTRTPSIRARLIMPIPSIVREDVWLQPITLQWTQAT